MFFLWTGFTLVLQNSPLNLFSQHTIQRNFRVVEIPVCTVVETRSLHSQYVAESTFWRWFTNFPINVGILLLKCVRAKRISVIWTRVMQSTIKSSTWIRSALLQFGKSGSTLVVKVPLTLLPSKDSVVIIHIRNHDCLSVSMLHAMHPLRHQVHAPGSCAQVC